jgi:hypothetical protein
MEVPPHLNLDALYYRAPEEEPYARTLSSLRVSADAVGPRLTMGMLSFPATLVPFRWPLPQTPCPADFRNFSPRGDLPNPKGGEIALDSAWALREGAMADDCGDPGRLIAELRKEGRDLTRKYAEFIPYQAVEYYQQSPQARHELYPAIPSWWDEVWVSQRMFVPLPPVLTYRAGAFIPEKAGTAEGNFFQRVLEAEWTALVFSRWCSDIPQRGIMWALSPRLRRNVDELGVDELLRGSRYAVADVKNWLWEHDTYAWAAKTLLYEERGSHLAEPPQTRRLVEFVREFPRYKVIVSSGTLLGRGSWAEVIAYAPAHQVAMYSTSGDFDPYAPPRPQLRSAPAPMVYDANATASADYTADTRARSDPEIPESLSTRIFQANLEDLVQYYARRVLGREEVPGLVPVTEEGLVLCIRALDRDYRGLRTQIGEMQASLDELRERLITSEERARRAERHSDLLADAYSLFGRDPQARKRSRGE